MKRLVWGKRHFPMPQGKMTIDKLALLVQQNFATMRVSFERLEAQTAGLRHRIDEVEANLGTRIGRVEGEIAAIRRQLRGAVYELELHALEQRVAVLERKAKIRAK